MTALNRLDWQNISCYCSDKIWISDKEGQMKKNVWIINHYAGGMLFDQGGRHYNFAKYLKQQADYEPVIFCASSEHGKPRQYFDTQDLWQKHTSEEIGVPWVFVRARTYVG